MFLPFLSLDRDLLSVTRMTLVQVANEGLNLSFGSTLGLFSPVTFRLWSFRRAELLLASLARDDMPRVGRGDQL